jgi:hypothetical protein
MNPVSEFVHDYFTATASTKGFAARFKLSQWPDTRQPHVVTVDGMPIEAAWCYTVSMDGPRPLPNVLLLGDPPEGAQVVASYLTINREERLPPRLVEECEPYRLALEAEAKRQMPDHTITVTLSDPLESVYWLCHQDKRAMFTVEARGQDVFACEYSLEYLKDRGVESAVESFLKLKEMSA